MTDIKVKVNSTFHEQLQNNKKWKKQSNSDYIAYRQRWVENPANYIVDRALIHLDIETSSVCNLRCPMCDCTIELEKGEKSQIRRGIMSWELSVKIIDEAAQIGVSSVKLNWRGEPTMNKRLADMVRYAKEKGIIDIMINTNGVRLDADLTKALIDAGLDQMFFSVDSIVPEKYNKIRVGAKFENVIDNIRYFAAYNEEKGHPVFTRVQKVLMKDTADENDEFIRFFENIVDQVAFEDYIPYGELSYGKSVTRGEKIEFACSQLWQRLLITWDGECYPCCPSGSNPYVVGNINENSIEEIWASKKLIEIRELHKKGKWYETELCKGCYVPYM